MPTNYGTFSYPGNVASNPSVGPNASAIPADSTLIGGENPSGNLMPIAVDASGKILLASESIEIGTVDQGTPNTATNGWPVKPTDGTNSQAFTASGEAKVDVTTTVLPPLAATSTKQSDGSQKTQIVDGSGNVIASTSNALNVDVTQPLPAGTNVIGHVINDASSAIIGKVGIDQTTPGTTNGVQVNAALPAGGNTIGNVGVVAGSAIIGKVGIDQTTPGTTNGVQVNAALPAGSNVIGKVSIDQTTPGTTNLVAAGQNGTWTVQPGNTANTTPWLVKESVSATATNSNVASSASSVTILASNANRLGATVFNDSTQILYLNLAGNAASSTNYTVQLQSNAYYELPTPHLYTGAITGIWASANGNARVTELS